MHHMSDFISKNTIALVNLLLNDICNIVEVKINYFYRKKSSLLNNILRFLYILFKRIFLLHC